MPDRAPRNRLATHEVTNQPPPSGDRDRLAEDLPLREALDAAWHHVQARHAFGRALAEQPLMRAVIADLALEVEAGVALCLRAARAFDSAARGEAHERALARLAC